MKTNKIKSCAGCVGLSKTTNVSEPRAFCSGLQETLKTDYVVYDKKLDIDVNFKPIKNCKCKTLLSFVTMLHNQIKKKHAN